MRRQEITAAMAEFFQKHRPTHRQRQFDLRAYEPARDRGPRPNRPAPSTLPPLAIPEAAERKYMQIHDSYIVEQTEDGFVIIDQHALHERMLYETLRKKIDRDGLESQRLLLPESFEVSDVQINAIERNGELIARLGIEIVPFGPKTYAVQAFPTLLAKASPTEFVQDLIDLLVEKTAVLDAEDLLDDVLNMTACKAAIKAGQRLSDTEIQQLLADREMYESTSRCPHGRPTTIRFSMSELEKQFKRT
jgi:DNA mismatch repair protein MutL